MKIKICMNTCMCQGLAISFYFDFTLIQLSSGLSWNYLPQVHLSKVCCLDGDAILNRLWIFCKANWLAEVGILKVIPTPVPLSTSCDWIVSQVPNAQAVLVFCVFPPQ